MKHLVVPTHLDPRLQAIKPKGCRIIHSYRIKRHHGDPKPTAASIINPKGISTVYTQDGTPKDSVAHEFGHVALRHVTPNVRESRKPWADFEPLSKHLNQEIDAWIWVKKHWQEPFKIHTKTLTHSLWLSHVFFTGQVSYNASADEVVKIVTTRLRKHGYNISNARQATWKRELSTKEWRDSVAKERRLMEAK